MTSTETLTLEQQIDLQIRTSGPISVATYMGLCLTHPSKGYYRAADPLGAKGDFVTAPEISQMFGELIGFWLVNLWQQMDQPKSFTLLELGPGRGTLMADILRVACRAPGFRDGLNLRLFETSPGLMAEQKARLEVYDPKWLQDFETFDAGPVLVIANEFFDALPIRQFVRKSDGWHERQVGLVEGKRAFGLSPTPIPATAMPDAVANAEPDTMLEVCFAAAEVLTRLGKVVSRQGGAVLAIDYGYATTQTGDTLQGVRRHAYADVLEAPGDTDLSAHVDFGALGNVARSTGLATQPLATQGQFLARLGIGERAAALTGANPASAPDIRAAHDRLVGQDQMGTLFKVFCAHSPGLAPVGFTA
ncbi:SAM-dependent methyltransferase [Devosia sp. XJ19-1]|uniref:SAM-dependent methyltransferase n=1 Tax=Devosia ureilytica TaxID=2952754 RepID=A0A9Q4APS4_9HYPH|nr:SAM-dependent methyltransferase [Devosia ureilytica]MCP8883908.1 SAM-dependent methyltransferase [Devosia ureilytica]MCP8887516.1 SAM-dependent methyltransferase [Devosia ureilytica]